MLENLNGYHLILASNSPRRRELLKGLGLDFSVVTPPDSDESFPANLSGEAIALHIARNKAKAFRPLLQTGDLVITADTIVHQDGKVFGKPTDRADAIRMLHSLSGNTHQVYTGVCLTSLAASREFVAVTDVTFSPLTEEEIGWYVDTCNPLDKAGAYGIQEWIGFVAVERISGSYFNVMGLPVHRLYEELKVFPGFL